MGFCIIFTSITMWSTTNWCYLKKILQSLHNDLGHQRINRMLDLLRERVYWPTMTQDASLCGLNVGDAKLQRAIIIPLPKFGHLIAHNPLDLVCLVFKKVDPSKGVKENVLVMLMPLPSSVLW